MAEKTRVPRKPGGPGRVGIARPAPPTPPPSTLEEPALTLTADPALPGQPVLYRIDRWGEEPASVGIDGPRVTVNQGGAVPRVADEAAVDGGRQSAWFYDADARRLIIKVVP